MTDWEGGSDSPFKVLVDENLYIESGDDRRRLEDEGVFLFTTVDVGLTHTENGALQDAAVGKGFHALVTFDKRMADQTLARLPVLVLDERSMSQSPAAFAVLVDVLVARDFHESDYYPVAVSDETPSPRLREIAAGLYRTNPRRKLAGRGFLQAHWDERDLLPPDGVEKKVRSAWVGRSHGQSRGFER